MFLLPTKPLVGLLTLLVVNTGPALARAPADARPDEVAVRTSWTASYFGGNGSDAMGFELITGMVVDPITQDIIVVGETNSPNAPITVGAADTVFAGGSEGFVARFSADLGILRAATYFGGDGRDAAYNVALDPRNGDILVVGFTNSTTLPGIAGAPQTLAGGGFDAFVARLSPNLDQILQSTFLGRLGNDFGAGIKVRESDRNIFIVGTSSSLTLPGSSAGAQPNGAGGGQDGFVTRFNTDLRTIGATSFQGGNGFDDLFDLWIDPANDDVVVTGSTTSTNLGNVAGAAQSTLAGGVDVQLARFSSSLNARVRSSYYGGSGNDYPNKLAFDPVTGGILVAGFTTSTALPGAVNTSQDHNGGGDDGYVVRFATDLGARGRSTFLGGENRDQVFDVLVQPDGKIVLTGFTSSIQFPGTSAIASPPTTVFVAQTANTMLENFSSVRWASEGTKTQGIAMVRSGLNRLCVGGNTNGAGLPYSALGAQPNYGGGLSDGFVTCLSTREFPIFVDGFD